MRVEFEETHVCTHVRVYPGLKGEIKRSRDKNKINDPRIHTDLKPVLPRPFIKLDDCGPFSR